MHFRIYRYDPDQDTKPYMKDYQIQLEPAMPTVRLRDASEYPEAAQKLFDLSKAWFNYDFAQPPAMSRVMASRTSTGLKSAAF